MDTNARFAMTGTPLKNMVFFKALLSGEQLEDTLHLEKVLEEYEVLEPFKAFLEVPCEICHEPVTEWGDYSVKLAIQGIGCGHTACWNRELGRLIELRKAIEKVKKTYNK